MQNAERLGRLVDREPPEVTQLDDSPESWVGSSELVERRIEGERVFVRRGASEDGVLELDSDERAAALVGVSSWASRT